MIASPWRFEPVISDQDLAKIGILTLRWSHIEHILGNCLKVLLRLSDDEAAAIVFPMNLETRINRIVEISEINPLSEHAQAALNEFRPVIKGLQLVRNNVVHAILIEDEREGHVFHLRSKQRTLSKTDVFSVEELTNYAAHLVTAFRYALGFKDGIEPVLYTWPDRPPIPEFLLSTVQFPRKQKA